METLNPSELTLTPKNELQSLKDAINQVAEKSNKDKEKSDESEGSDEETKPTEQVKPGEEQKKKKKKKEKKKEKKKATTATQEESKTDTPVVQAILKQADIPINPFIEQMKKEFDNKLIKERAQDNASTFRILGDWKAGEYQQTMPPTIPVDNQFPDKKFPIGVVTEYKNGASRTTNAEKREKKIN